MSNLIKFDVYIDFTVPTTDDNGTIGKVPIIRALRDAVPAMGLNEAKEAVESADCTYRTWLMTPAQFGIWMTHKFLIAEKCVFGGRAIEVIEVQFHKDDVDLDCTK